MDVKQELIKKIEDKKEKMIEIRRYLHAHPEPSFHEDNTAKYIAKFYEGKDCKIKTNVGNRGIVVTIDGQKPGKTIALRADFDALPIQEENDFAYKSVNEGYMHACGHDGHTAYMMILAESLIELKDQFNGRVVILHQDAEEVPPGGAKAMIEAGCLDGVDHVLGVHFWALTKLGVVEYTLGPTSAGRSTFKVKILGKGGHGASPQDANDALIAGAFFVNAIQTIISRRISPFQMATLTIGNFNGVGSSTVIRDSIFLEGDVHVIDDDTKEIIRREFKRILEGIKAMFGVEYELFYEDDYPAIINDKKLTTQIVESIKNAKIGGVKTVEVGPSSGGEDFAYYAQVVPSTFLIIGAKPNRKKVYPSHHPKFEINEDAMLVAGKVIGTATLDLLDKKD